MMVFFIWQQITLYAELELLKLLYVVIILY